MVSNPRFDFVFDLLELSRIFLNPYIQTLIWFCFLSSFWSFFLLIFLIFFLTIILYNFHVFPNPSKRRPGELRALVVPLEKVRCRLIMEMCHVLLCKSLYQKSIHHTVRIDFCVHFRDPRGSSRFTLCDDNCTTTVQDSRSRSRST